MSLVATRKISLTLDEGAIERARQLVGPRGLSSYVDKALQKQLEHDEKRQAILAWFDELDELDPPTPEERERAARRAAEIMADIRTPDE